MVRIVKPASWSFEQIYMPDSGTVCGCWIEPGALDIYIEEDGELKTLMSSVALIRGATIQLGPAWGRDVRVLVRHHSGYRCRDGEHTGTERCG
jgi:hypothetical protein